METLSVSTGASMGQVGVATTSGGGHSLEFFAERIVARLISVSETAPEPIKAQALHYRDQMLVIVLDGLRRAQASDRAYLFAGQKNPNSGFNPTPTSGG
jgi:hypothetical protein